MTIGTFHFLFELAKLLVQTALFVAVWIRKRQRTNFLVLFCFFALFSAAPSFFVFRDSGRMSNFCQASASPGMNPDIRLSECELSVRGFVYENMFADSIVLVLSGLPILIFTLSFAVVFPVRLYRKFARTA